jgi:sucrose-6-phosphate hydrolase SacC (GH32 family)
MTIPRELRLEKTVNGLRLKQLPIVELKSLRGEPLSFTGGTMAKTNAWIREHNIRSGPLELSFKLENANGLAGVRIYSGKGQSTTIAVDAAREQVSIDRTKSGQTAFHPKFANVQVAPVPRKDGPTSLRIFIDTSSVEVFVNDGEQVLTSLIFPAPEDSGIEFFGPEKTRISTLEVWPFNRAW